MVFVQLPAGHIGIGANSEWLKRDVLIQVDGMISATANLQVPVDVKLIKEPLIDRGLPAIVLKIYLEIEMHV